MLTEAALQNLRPRSKIYKVTDRDGMYVVVSTAGAITFRYDYRMHGRRETLTIGRYGRTGISLAKAREKCLDARRLVEAGVSPAHEKQRDKRRLLEAKSFGQFAERWFKEAPMADSTRAMRRSIYERDLGPFENRLLKEIEPGDVGRSAPRSRTAGRRRRRCTSATSSSRSTASRVCTARRSPTRRMRWGRRRSRPSRSGTAR